MTMIPHLPSGYGNCRYLFDGPGLQAIVGTSLAFAHPLTDGSDAAETLADLFLDGVIQDGARLNNFYTFVGTQVTIGDDDDLFQLYVATRSVPGTQGSGSPPPNVAKLVRKRTAFIGRKYRGRMYWPAGTLFETEVSDGGGVLSGVIDGENASLEVWRDAMESAGYPPVLLHSKGTYVNRDGATVTVAPLAPTPVVALTMDPVVSTQRRRLR